MQYVSSFHITVNVESEKSEFLKNKKDRFKYVVVLNENCIRQMDIFNIMKELQHISMDELEVKIRIYLRKDKGGLLILQPMILQSLYIGAFKTLDEADEKAYITVVDNVAKKTFDGFYNQSSSTRLLDK